MEEVAVIPYTDIPHFSKSSAVGHANELVIGKLERKTVGAMNGRYHYYEVKSLNVVTIPVRVMQTLRIDKLIITNTSGAVNVDLNPCELMVNTDHIKLVGTNPLMGPNNNES